MSEAVSQAKGSWRQVAVIVDGKDQPVTPGVMLTVNDSGYTVTVGGKVYQRGTSETDSGMAPYESEVVVTEGANAGQRMSQIFRIEGDVLIACLAPAGKPRPTEFASTAGSGHTLSVWVRMTEADARAGATPAFNWWLVIIVFVVLFASNATTGFRKDFEQSLGYWVGVSVGVLIGTGVVVLICLALRWGWRAGLTLGLTMSVAINTFTELKTALEPTLGVPGAILVSGATSAVAGGVVGGLMNKLLRLRW